MRATDPRHKTLVKLPVGTNMTSHIISPRAHARPNLRENDETMECSLCLKTFTTPKLLPCFHTFCLRCLQEYVERNAHNQKFACPLCAFECVIPAGGVDELQTNFYIKAAQTKLKIAANSPCEVSFTTKPRKHDWYLQQIVRVRKGFYQSQTCKTENCTFSASMFTIKAAETKPKLFKIVSSELY